MSKTDELTLLYVEDDKALREQFLRVFKPKFKAVYEAVDGEEALDKYKKHHPNMMVVDINLPKINGLEVIKRIRDNDNDTAIVIMSAYSDQQKLLKAITLGLSDYMVKPVPYKKLLALLEVMALKYKNIREKHSLTALQNGYFWNKEEKILSYDDEVIPLTKREMILLDLLVKQLNKIVTLESIAALIWQNEEDKDYYSSLSHLLKRLRKKLPEALIENIYAEGYRIHSV